MYLAQQSKGHAEVASLTDFAAPRQSAFNLTQSLRIIAKIRQMRNKVYQTELASTAVQTLKEVMEDHDAPASARIAAARISLGLAGDIGKTPEELSAIIDRWEGEKAAIAKDITPV